MSREEQFRPQEKEKPSEFKNVTKPSCTRCNSRYIKKMGFRKTINRGQQQRWLCKFCKKGNLIPHEKFIGKPNGAPLPFVKQTMSSKSDVYFSPRDKRFIGHFNNCVIEILHLASPEVVIMLNEQTGYYNTKDGRSYLDIEIKLGLDYYKCVNPKYADSEKKLSREQIFSNLEFLLGFILNEKPTTTPVS